MTFLSPEETARLGGYKIGQNGWIARGLKKKGIRIFAYGAKGEPLVRTSDVESKSNKNDSWEPRLDKVT